MGRDVDSSSAVYILFASEKFPGLNFCRKVLEVTTMLNVNLSSGLVGLVVNRIVKKYLTKMLGADAAVVINELTLKDEDNRVTIDINATVSTTKTAALSLFDKF